MRKRHLVNKCPIFFMIYYDVHFVNISFVYIAIFCHPPVSLYIRLSYVRLGWGQNNCDGKKSHQKLSWKKGSSVKLQFQTIYPNPVFPFPIAHTLGDLVECGVWGWQEPNTHYLAKEEKLWATTRFEDNSLQKRNWVIFRTNLLKPSEEAAPLSTLPLMEGRDPS